MSCVGNLRGGVERRTAAVIVAAILIRVLRVARIARHRTGVVLVMSCLVQFMFVTSFRMAERGFQRARGTSVV